MTGDLEMAHGPRGEIFVRFPGGPWQRALATVSPGAGSTGLFGACFGDLESDTSFFGDAMDQELAAFTKKVQSARPLPRSLAWLLLERAKTVLEAAQRADSLVGVNVPGKAERAQTMLLVQQTRAAINPLMDPVPEPIAQAVRDLVVKAFSLANQARGATQELARLSSPEALYEMGEEIANKAKAIGQGIGEALQAALVVAAAIAAFLIFGGD